MTAQEAINFFKSYKFVGSRDCGKSQMLQDVIKADIKAIAYAKAISALEKQIPKKPIEKPTRSLFADIRCPDCKTLIGRHQKYCKECGQAFDWSDD